MVTRKRLLLVLCIAMAVLAWNTISAQEKAMLHVPGARDDYYTRVWVVDAKPYVWIRAETPTRRWLEPLRENPDVYLWRGGVRKRYHAVIWEGQASDAGAYVDALFLEKYGYVERARSLLRRAPTIPIRLDPR